MHYPFTPEQLCLLNVARMSWARRASAKRHSLAFGEESITETILMDLADKFPGSLFILPFNKREEGKNGADWAWAFESADGSSVLPMLVQAKLLALNDVDYPEIKRKIGKSNVRQIDRLINTARKWGWPAVYAFYNHLNDDNRLPPSCGSLGMAGASPMPEAWGISLGDAYLVRAALDDQSFETHRNHSMPLHCLLCSYGRGDHDPSGSPAKALDSLKRLRANAPTVSFGDNPPLPRTPFLSMPSIFRDARHISSQENLDQRAAQLQSLGEQYPGIAGVVILRDAKRPPVR